MITQDKKRKTKIVELISSFSKEDHLRFGKFIRSPFFNENPKLIKMYDFFIKENAGQSELTNQDIFRYIYPNKIYNSGIIRKLSFQLSVLVEKYFVLINQENYFQYHNIFLIKEMNKRNLGNLLEREIANYEELLNDKYLSDPIFIMGDLQIRYEVFRLNFSKLEFEESKKAANSIFELSEKLNISLKMIYFIIDLLTNHLLHRNSELIFIDDILIKNKEIIYSCPTLTLMYMLIKILRYDDINTIEELVDYTKKNLKNIHYGTIDLVFNVLLSYIVFSHEFTGKIVKSMVTYKDLEELGIIKRHKIVSPYNYLYISILSSILSEDSQKIYYLEQYSKKISFKIKDDIFNISLAILQFSNSNYGEALKSLAITNVKDLHLNAIVRVLKIRIFYETKEDKLINADLDSLKHFISRRKDITKSLYSGLSNFITYFNFLNTIFKFSPEERRKRLHDLIKEPYCTNKEWLVKKLNIYA